MIFFQIYTTQTVLQNQKQVEVWKTIC